MLSLKMASEYKFLNQSGCLKINGVDDANNFITLVDAFDTFGIPHEVQENVFDMVAAILWLGNISFGVIDKEEHVVPVADETSRTAARLMCCKTDDLVELLSTNKIHDTTTRLTLQQATVKRDALAKFIYESLFNWLVEEINTSLKGDKQYARHTISIIDIYGFESFPKNSFSQLFINYANERLQHHFIQHLCKLEQEFVAVIRGENARREYNASKKQNQWAALSSYDQHLPIIVHIQSVVRGWLARKYFKHIQRWKKSAINNSRNKQKSQSKNSESKDSSQESVEELKKRVAKAESLLRERDLENTALREQVREFETRLSEYENKTKAVEEMWHSQMASLQMSLAAAKKTLLGSGISDGPTGRPDGSVSPNYYDSEDNISGIPAPVQMTPLRLGHKTNGVPSNAVDNLSREFEQRKQSFDNDVKSVVNVNPGRPPSSKQIEEFKSLKKKFEIWKKEYKHRLREAKTTLVHAETGGGGGGDRRGRTWWGKLSKRGKERVV
ncbi:myosin-2-like [Bidens hawaiensis]|uniref:myosin-2-like n=1 Tax=Bidens hawaiensis TaxID=980011 RepID=UPI004049162D